MKEKNFALAVKKIVRKCRDASANAFDFGISMKIAATVRRKFTSLSLRSAGVFLFTFGIYSIVVALAKMFFREKDPVIDITVALLAALSAIPLMASSMTLGESLVKTGTGKTILDFIGIRREAVRTEAPFGRANVAFVLGVAFGTLTFFSSPGDMLLMIAIAILGGVILTVPESSVMFAAIFLPLGMDVVCITISLLGIISFAIKLLRFKRTAKSSIHDKAAAVMLLLLILGALICVSGNGSYSYIALMASYFVVSYSLSTTSLAGRLVSVLVASGGLSAAVCSAFAIFDYALAGGKKSFPEAIESISVFDSEVLSVVLCALIPVAVSLLLSGGALSRSTSFLSAVSMIAFLVLNGSYVILTAALIGTVAAIMFYNRRVAYLLVAVGIAALVAWSWLGGEDMAVPTLFADLLGRPEGSETSYQYFMFGEGLSGGFGTGGSFYMAVTSRLGFVGIAVLVAFAALIAYETISLARRSSKAGVNIYKNACIPLCGLIAFAVCGIRINIWESREAFMLFWLLCGAASAYLAGGNQRVDKLLEAGKEEKSRSAAGVTIK